MKKTLFASIILICALLVSCATAAAPEAEVIEEPAAVEPAPVAAEPAPAVEAPAAEQTLSEKYAGLIYIDALDATYENLQQAMDEAKGYDCKLYVFKDITADEVGFYVNNKGCTMEIDFNGHTIDGSKITVAASNFYYGTFDLRGGSFILKNATILGNANLTSTGVIRASNAASVTLENVNISSSATGDFNYAMLVNKTPVVINNTEANTIQGAIKVTKDSTEAAPASVTINGGNFTTFSGNETISFVLETYAVTAPKAFNINGGAFNGLIKINANEDMRQLVVDEAKYTVAATDNAELFSITAK